MEWWIVISCLIGGLLLLLVIGLPVAFSFLLVNLVGAFVFMGGARGLSLATQQIFTSLTTFTLAPIPLFILMGEVMLHSGMAARTLDVIDKWVGRLPGRLSLLVIVGGTLFSTLSGSTIANTAMLGETMVPEMQARGYRKPMILGPIIGVGGLAMLIPPSALAVVYASLAQLSVGKVLIAGALPGLLLGSFYLSYVALRCFLNPAMAPPYDVARHSLAEKLRETVTYVVPLGIIFFLVLGVIFLGIATPTEAAATGAVGSLILAAIYKGLSFQALRKALSGTLRVTVMAFMIIAASQTYSAILAFTGSTREMVQLISGLAIPGIVTIMLMMVILLILGTFMEQVSMMMITVPVFMPITTALGYDPIWFALLVLLNIEMGMSTPPFGMLLFVMKGSAPAGTSMEEIVRAALPFLGCDLLLMIVILLFPSIVLYLPSLM